MITPPIHLLPEPALLIGDQRITNASGGVHSHVYAATGTVTRDVPLAGPAEVDRAVAAARRALPEWSGMPANRRRT